MLLLISRGESFLDDFKAQLLSLFAPFQKGLRLRVCQLVISYSGATLMGFHLANLVLVGAGAQRSHHLHTSDRGHSD